MKSRDNQCVGLVHLITAVAREGRKHGLKYGSGGWRRTRKWISQHRAPPVLFGVENYRKQQGQSPAFITLALVTESSPFAALLLQIFSQKQLKYVQKDYCWCHSNTQLQPRTSLV